MCRREGIKLYLKGARCDSPKCAIERRNTAPGMHGHRRGKPSEYGVRLREKQKLKRFYGLFERQFRRYFELASRSKQNTGEALLVLMERRLDNVVHRLGFAPNRASARQLVSHGHIFVNNRSCTIPSLLLKVGDTITVARQGAKEKEFRAVLKDGPGRPSSLKLVRAYLTETPQPMPDYLERVEGEVPEGRLTRLPTRADVDPRIAALREQLIIEFCGR
jgi:small subunit ribosomal protein S4